MASLLSPQNIFLIKGELIKFLGKQKEKRLEKENVKRNF